MNKALLILAGLVLSGCLAASMMLIGGSTVQDYQPSKIMATYDPLGNAPEGTQFFLIEHRGRLAMYRKDRDGSGILYEKHWVEKENDYFSAAFYGNGPAFILFIPLDRSQEGGLFEYPHGSYQGMPGDRIRPKPYNPKSEPDLRLVPKS